MIHFPGSPDLVIPDETQEIVQLLGSSQQRMAPDGWADIPTLYISHYFQQMIAQSQLNEDQRFRMGLAWETLHRFRMVEVGKPNRELLWAQLHMLLHGEINKALQSFF